MTSKQSSRVWFSPHGTEWDAETYEEALEQERDALVEQLEAAERHADEMRQLAHRQGETLYDMTVQIASLRHALTQVRAECELPDHIAEFIGEVLASAAGVRGHA